MALLVGKDSTTLWKVLHFPAQLILVAFFALNQSLPSPNGFLQSVMNVG